MIKIKTISGLLSIFFFSLVLLAFVAPNDAEVNDVPELLDLRVHRIAVIQGLRLGSCNTVDVVIKNLSPNTLISEIPLKLIIEEGGSKPRTYTVQMNGLGSYQSKKLRFKKIKVENSHKLKLKATINLDKELLELNYNNNVKIVYQKPKGDCSRTPTILGGSE